MARNWMEYKGFKARIMEAERLTGEGVHGLPPGYELPSYPADLFEKWPENWMKGPGVFIVPVKPNKGLWFDWRANDPDNTAIIPTVKGCNPITGLQTSGFHLERYETKCPKHSCDFLADRFCPECKYKWPMQDYISVTPMWWDGFRSDEGSVRQFFFTEDELRDVASALISKENTVPAFGFAFYRPKQWRQVNISSNAVYLNNNESLYSIFNAAPVNNSGTVNCFSSSVMYSAASNFSETLTPDKGYSGPIGASASASCDVDYEQKTSGGIISSGRRSDLKCSSMRSMSKSRSVESSPNHSERHILISDGGMDSQITPDIKIVKEVSIGAGAKIEQTLKNDPYPLDSWKDTPDAVMTLYFVFQEKFEELKAGGLRDLTGIKEGMLANIPVG